MKFAITICLFLLQTGLFAQAQDSLYKQVKTVQSNFRGPDKLEKLVHKAFRRARDSVAFAEARSAVAERLATEGYAEFNLDTFSIRGKTLHLDFYMGQRYFYDTIAIEGINEVYYFKAGFPKIARQHAPLDWRDFRRRMAWCLNAYQNQGYPFARFDSLDLGWRKHGDSLLATIRYSFEPGKLVRIDSVVVEGDVRENDAFIRSVTGLYPGDAFNQERISNAPKMLNNSIYFKNTRQPEVIFPDEEKAKVKLKLASRKAGKFDLLVGILPPRDETARLEFTGLADFQLVSPIFRAGEILNFRFDKLVGSSQKMHLQYTHPYLFGSPMKVHGEFDLLKQDTSFLTRYFKFATFYSFTPALALKVYYKNKTSTLISTSRFENDSINRPPVLDGRDQTYGLGFEFENLDYRFNPRRGFRIRADFGLGRKRIIDNPKLHDDLYEGLETNLPKKEADFRVEWYRSYSKRLVLKLGNHTYWLDQKQYFDNDLLQVGGSRSIRGFDENQFFTNFYSLFTLENRFILEQNSYLFVFTDYAYLENQVSNVDRFLRPWGLGIGLTYETKAGMVSVTYAVGQVKDFPFQPSRGRIHVGLINQF